MASRDIEPGGGLARRYCGGVGGGVGIVNQGQLHLQRSVIHIGVLPAYIQVAWGFRVSKQIISIQSLFYLDVAHVLVVGKLNGRRRALRAVFAHRCHFHCDDVRA